MLALSDTAVTVGFVTCVSGSLWLQRFENRGRQVPKEEAAAGIGREGWGLAPRCWPWGWLEVFRFWIDFEGKPNKTCLWWVSGGGERKRGAKC